MHEQEPYLKRIICLANSRKTTGRCIAGREFDGTRVGDWIRPVSRRPTEEVSPAEIRLADGHELRVLDLIEVPLTGPCPHACQVENHRIASGQSWTRVGRFPRSRLASICQDAERLWIDGHSSVMGLNDRVPTQEADRLDSSLVLIRPRWLALAVVRGFNRKRLRAHFAVAGTEYRLIVTDPIAESTFFTMGTGYFRMGVESALCVSLGEPYEGFRYKLVASVIDCRPEAEEE